MTISPPQRGDVIRYSYLWADEYTKGRDEGRKDRPAIVLALSVITQDSQTRVLVVAVTHTPPRQVTDAVAFPHRLKKELGLDDRLAWIVTTEANAFLWPGPDIRPVPGSAPRTIHYGRLPASLLRKIAQSYLANLNRQQSRIVDRTD